MKTTSLLVVGVLLFAGVGAACAERQLDNSEIQQIYRILTNNPREAWIGAGTIEAAHRQYQSSDESVRDSSVTVKYDGQRFYWEITVDSYTSGKPRTSKGGGSLSTGFDVKWNKRRVFVWDGRQYTMYYGAGNNAIVMEDPQDFSVGVHGPLTAGIVPWGYGIYTLEGLLAAQSSAFEVESDGAKQVHLTLKVADRPQLNFVLDPAREYAVLSWSNDYNGRPAIVRRCEDYKLHSGRWVPGLISIERYDVTKEVPKLLSYDHWRLVSVSLAACDEGSFEVAYAPDALIEFYSPINEKPLFYRLSETVDTDRLLNERLAIIAEEPGRHNCATTALKYVASQLGQDVSDEELAGLLDEPEMGASLLELREVAKGLGLHCRAVKTDLEGLKQLKEAKAILHLPGPKHYVVLESVDQKQKRVWITDLDSNKFHYRKDFEEFDLGWGGGTALLVSNQPVASHPGSVEINDSELAAITGGAAGYSCSRLLHSGKIRHCHPMIFGTCGSLYHQWWWRVGCEPNSAGGGSCTGVRLPQHTESVCITDPHDPLDCTVCNEWHTQYIRACNDEQW